MVRRGPSSFILALDSACKILLVLLQAEMCTRRFPPGAPKLFLFKFHHFLRWNVQSCSPSWRITQRRNATLAIFFPGKLTVLTLLNRLAFQKGYLTIRISTAVEVEESLKVTLWDQILNESKNEILSLVYM